MAGSPDAQVLRQFASPYFVARSPGMLNVQEAGLASLAPSRLVWLATCHSTRLTHYHSRRCTRRSRVADQSWIQFLERRDDAAPPMDVTCVDDGRPIESPPPWKKSTA